MAGSRFNFLGKTGETAPASEMLADNNLSNNAAELSKYRFHARTMAKLLLCVNYSFELRDTNPHDVRVKNTTFSAPNELGHAAAGISIKKFRSDT